MCAPIHATPLHAACSAAEPPPPPPHGRTAVQRRRPATSLPPHPMHPCRHLEEGPGEGAVLLHRPRLLVLLGQRGHAAVKADCHGARALERHAGRRARPREQLGAGGRRAEGRGAGAGGGEGGAWDVPRRGGCAARAQSQRRAAFRDQNRNFHTCGSLAGLASSPGKKRPTRRTSGPAAAAAATASAAAVRAAAANPVLPRHAARSASSSARRPGGFGVAIGGK